MVGRASSKLQNPFHVRQFHASTLLSISVGFGQWISRVDSCLLTLPLLVLMENVPCVRLGRASFKPIIQFKSYVIRFFELVYLTRAFTLDRSDIYSNVSCLMVGRACFLPFTHKHPLQSTQHTYIPPFERYFQWFQPSVV